MDEQPGKTESGELKGSTLPDDKMINESYSRNPFPFWFWLVFLAVLFTLIGGARSWYRNYVDNLVVENPFLQVTNRQFSLFLWQNPEYMRINSKQKKDYLVGFQYHDKVNLEIEFSEKYVSAPPGLIFQYHVWDRLVGKDYIARPIPVEEFQQFLEYTEEWQPANWQAAPKDYIVFANDLLNTKSSEKLDNLASLPESTLPIPVRRAFQGWKNYFKEGDLINKIAPTYQQMEEFLKTYPHYARNYWRNIFIETTPDYLKSLALGTAVPTEEIPQSELSPSLRVAYFNYQQQLKSL
jgi:hypothetical protein